MLFGIFLHSLRIPGELTDMIRRYFVEHSCLGCNKILENQHFLQKILTFLEMYVSCIQLNLRFFKDVILKEGENLATATRCTHTIHGSACKYSTTTTDKSKHTQCFYPFLYTVLKLFRLFPLSFEIYIYIKDSSISVAYDSHMSEMSEQSFVPVKTPATCSTLSLVNFVNRPRCE